MTLPRRAFLGAELSGDDVAFSPAGLTIAGVSAGGMAASAGLVGGDRIFAIGDLPVRDPCELGVALRNAGGRPTIEIRYVRKRQVVDKRVAVVTLAREPGVTYGEIAVAGARLRTLVTRAEQPIACVLVLQGIACESIDHAASPEEPLAGLIQTWTESGLDTVRVDKRGVGDSEGGPCAKTDFETERSDARAALAFALTQARERHVPVVIFGHSVGGILAPLVGGEAAAIVVYGTPVERWLACLRDSVRRQLELRDAPADVIAAEVGKLDELAKLGELNGRSAAYHQQLDQLDIAAAWRAITAPVLVVRGEHDWVVRPDDQERIGDLAASGATIADLPHLDHLMGWHEDRAASVRDYGIGRFDPSIAITTADWIRRTLRA